jgi:P-type E1-E2 ATPase
MIHGKPALIGSREFIESNGIYGNVDAALDKDQRSDLIEAEKTGSTIIFLCYDRKVRGVFVVSDKVRNEAAEAVSMLKNAGLGVAMVTGDNLNTAEAVAKKTGIESVKAQVSPMEKAGEIRRMKNEGRHVLMAGDGINDAPALVQATVGVAMGRATDIALESADIVIMRSDLRLVADAVALTKKTFRVIRQNIFWAFFYNIVVIPLAILGILHPIMAAGAMAFSSLSVVGNSLRARMR